MRVPLTHRRIRERCGRLSYEKGLAFQRARKVVFTDYNPHQPRYQATVKGNVPSHVTVEWGTDGMEATCTCPSLHSYDQDCQHIAAVLIAIHELEQDGRSPVIAGADDWSQAPRMPVDAALERRLTTQVLGLFAEPDISTARVRFDSRTPLEAEIICKLVAYGYQKHMFGIELKIGSKRRYIVKKIKEFLERIEQGKPYEFSSHFTYDPALHCFQKEDEAVFQQLIEISRQESMYRETAHRSSFQQRENETRTLLVPPISWDKLLPSLQKASTLTFETDSGTGEGIAFSDEPLPLRFSFDQASPDSYRMDIAGLEQVTVMEPYGVAISAGKLHKLPPAMVHRLAQLKSLLSVTRQSAIPITQEQMEPFMAQVVPELRKVGSVAIAQEVASRLVRTQLQARLYLDRVRERLLAGLEFQYGAIVFNPLEENAQSRGMDLIVVRDGERERHILEWMEQSGFTRTEAGYYLEGEEAEFDFLYRIVPQLEKLLKVFATSAVKARLHAGYAPPKLRVDVDERTNWLEFQFDIDGIPEGQIRELLRSLEEKQRYYRLPNGALLPLESAEFQTIQRVMGELGVHGKEVQGNQLRLPVLRGLAMMDVDHKGTAITVGRSLRRLLENVRNPDNLDFPVPQSLAPVLRDYQVFGYQWMKTIAHYHFGGILADDMGLGKTVQSIAFLVSVLAEIRERKQPALIVSPASLVYNWRNELKKFAPELRAVIADGSKKEREQILQAAALADVIITSYPLLRRDFAVYAQHAFHTLILDEAQAFKNYATQTAHAVKGVQAAYRFALTGTPVENGLDELWSIYDAVFPGLFPARKAFHELSREAVAKRVRPFLLRREKADVLRELPDKIEALQTSALLPEQRKLYIAYLVKLQQETLKHLNEDSFQQNRIKILAGLTRLRQLCCHPALFVEGYEGSSAKFEQLMEILEECRLAGKRVLVFSQFTQMLGLIGRELGRAGIPFFYLDGNTPAAERVELCSRFNDGERSLFLLSLKAGGTGLNLTGADTVILYDLWWNPAVEQQAADRAHRIGQKNVVHVIRLVAEGTVEEKMVELQQKKKNLVQEVIQPGQEALSSLTEQEIRELLMLG